MEKEAPIRFAWIPWKEYIQLSSGWIDDRALHSDCQRALAALGLVDPEPTLTFPSPLAFKKAEEKEAGLGEKLLKTIEAEAARRRRSEREALATEIGAKTTLWLVQTIAGSGLLASAFSSAIGLVQAGTANESLPRLILVILLAASGWLLVANGWRKAHQQGRFPIVLLDGEGDVGRDSYVVESEAKAHGGTE